MEITRPAVAGTLESSDCQVMIEEGDGKVEFSLESSVINQYGNQIRKVALETLENLGVNNAKVKIVDKGALDCTIKARIEAAVYRSVLQTEDLPWGGETLGSDPNVVNLSPEETLGSDPMRRNCRKLRCSSGTHRYCYGSLP